MSSGVFLAEVLESTAIGAAAAAYFTHPVAHSQAPQLVTVRGNKLEVQSVRQVPSRPLPGFLMKSCHRFYFDFFVCLLYILIAPYKN